MENAKSELLQFLKDKPRVLCMEINLYVEDYYLVDNEEDKLLVHITIPMGYSLQKMDNEIEKLNLDYDSGYGLQYLFGTIWHTDGSWSTRGEYDGSEWWEYNTCPSIPDNLRSI